MGDAARLVRAMRQAGSTPENETVDLVNGYVKSTSPLVVTTENGLSLTSDFLVASPFAWDSTIPESIRIGNGLTAGSKVVMLKCGKGQKFYILHMVN